MQNIRLTTDVVILTYIDNEPYLLLVRRKYDPFAGYWALPGGFMEDNELLEDTAKRELLEETGLSVNRLDQCYILDDPNRDSRGRTVSVVYFCTVPYEDVKGSDDATEAKWIALCDINPNKLAFDHRKALEYLQLI